MISGTAWVVTLALVRSQCSVDAGLKDSQFVTLKKIIFIFDFSERGREGEEGQKHQCERETSIGMGTKPETKACAPTGN